MYDEFVLQGLKQILSKFDLLQRNIGDQNLVCHLHTIIINHCAKYESFCQSKNNVIQILSLINLRLQGHKYI